MALLSDVLQAQQLPPQPNPPSIQSAADPRSPPSLHRAASFDSAKEEEGDHGPGSPGVKRTFSDLSLSSSSKNDLSFRENLFAGKEILRRVTLRSPNKSKAAVPRSIPRESPKVPATTSANGNTLKQKPTLTVTGNGMEDIGGESRLQPPVRPTKARSVSGKIATLARVPWMASSRSPSPASTDSKRGTSTSREQSPTRVSQPGVADDASLRSEQATPADLPEDSSRRTGNKRARRPLSAFVPRTKSADPSPTPPSPSLRGRKSLDQVMPHHVSTADLPPLPKAPVISLPSTIDPPRKKDQLWSVFRSLEADLHKFQAKSTNLKVNVIRSSLLPFLSRYVSHPSLNSLRPEDLDRRVNILNKWWTALLAMLHGRNHQSVSGTDRPAYLEAMTGIMMRMEWQIPYQPHAFSATSSKSSLESSSDDFLVESIYHNVRNIFNQNLLSQMSFVVDRMSVKQAPASLVIFCGQACAYAFYFCPGIADMLVRLWNIPADILRRIFTDPSIHKGLGVRSIARDLAVGFPLPVRPLAFASHAAVAKYFRQPLNLPLSAVHIQWHGPWVSRWCGRDSDLFFVFVKHFHILHCNFLSARTEYSQRIFAPAMLLVQGQLLVVLEDTIYRQSSSQMPENTATSSVTFDDLMGGPDAAMSALPLGGANCQRSMTENRLITLLRDLLSDPSPNLEQARRSYTDTFMRTLKSAARRISLFDHNACFILCDFVEEAAPLVNRYSRKIMEDVFDWPFWVDVCKQMTRSQNSLTEVRLFAFVFSIWKTWTSDPKRHRELCELFLLNDEYFYHYFSHWSPMVRAYFHRLLCWRVARFNEYPTPVDSEIYELFLDKLEQVWAYYLSTQSKAAKERKTPLSSAPCTPAPGRRILIIRCDNQQPSPTNLFTSFDRVTTPPSTLNNGGYRSHGVLTVDPSGFPPESQSAPKRRWNMLKSMFTATNNPKPGEVTPPGSSDESETTNPVDNFMGDSITPTTSSSSQDSGNQAASDGDSSHELQNPHQPYIFKFSLEWHQWSGPSKNRRLYAPGLPNSTFIHVQRLRTSALSGPATDDEPPTDDCIDELKGDQRDTDTSTASTSNSYATNKTSVDEAEAFDTSKLRNERLVASKYAGRALAEWSQVVSECDNFYERRRDEGVPSDDLVEIPTLSVDSFRK